MICGNVQRLLRVLPASSPCRGRGEGDVLISRCILAMNGIRMRRRALSEWACKTIAFYSPSPLPLSPLWNNLLMTLFMRHGGPRHNPSICPILKGVAASLLASPANAPPSSTVGVNVNTLSSNLHRRSQGAKLRHNSRVSPILLACIEPKFIQIRKCDSSMSKSGLFAM